MVSFGIFSFIDNHVILLNLTQGSASENCACWRVWLRHYIPRLISHSLAYTTLNQNLSIAVLHCTSLFSLSLTLLFVSFFQLPMLPLCFTPCLFILFWPYHILLNICFLFSNFLVLFNLWGDNEIQKQNLRIISKIKLHNFNYKTV